MGSKFSMIRIAIALLAYLLIFAVGGHSQVEAPKPVHVDVVPTVDRYPAGGSYSFLLHVTVDEPWHINSDKPLEELLIPTTVSIEAPEGVSSGRLAFPEGHLRAFDFSDTDLSVFEREFYVIGTLAISSDVDPGRVRVKGVLEYQACNDMFCLPPQPAPFEINMEVVAPGESWNALNEEVLAQATATMAEDERTGDAGVGFGSGGLLVTFLLVYIGGLALNLTPCIYPLIPITVGYFGGQSEGRRGRLLVHAILYVIGMSITYSLLGVFASLTGSLLGQALQNPLVLVFIALVMVALALSMFGMYEIRVPQFLARGASQSKQGYFGTTFMGLTVGIIAAPCIGPFVLGLMTYVGEKGNPLLGFLMFFVLAIGLGTPFLFLALSSGAINQLPRSGDWMVCVKKVFGIVLLGMAVYFLNPLLPSSVLKGVVLVFALAAGAYIGFVEGSGKDRSLFPWVKKAVGLLIVLVGIYFILPGETATSELPWIPFEEGVLDQHRRSARPAMIDFTADWCIPCKELDHYTFSDPRFVALSKEMFLIKVDLTSFSSPQSIAVREKFGIKGVPTVLFLDRGGQEIEDLRFVGFIDADTLIRKLDELGLDTSELEG
jgi:thiol:disulfide interchange protein DsbD